MHAQIHEHYLVILHFCILRKIHNIELQAIRKNYLMDFKYLLLIAKPQSNLLCRNRRM